MRFVRIETGDWWEGKRFRRLGSEGYDNDGDFELAEDDLGGIDPNRNFPWDFRKENGKSYPLSEPETRNVLNYQLKKKNILVSFNYHNVGRLIMYMMPPEAKKPAPASRPRETASSEKDIYRFVSPRRVDSEYQHDADVFNKTVSAGLYILKNYEAEPGNEYGEHLATTYYLQGAYAFLIELWGPPTPFADTNQDGSVSDDEFQKWIALDLGGDAWVKPHPVTHPQLGPIWIGGTAKKHIGRTPPPRYIEQEADKHCMYVMYCIEQLPKLAFGNYSVKKTGNNLYEIEVEVVNDKLFPTASDRSVVMKRYTPDRITARVSSGSVINPVDNNTGNASPTSTYYRTHYRKDATPAGEQVTFRARGNSTQVFRYTVLSGNSNATLNLSLESANGGKATLQINLSGKS